MRTLLSPSLSRIHSFFANFGIRTQRKANFNEIPSHLTKPTSASVTKRFISLRYSDQPLNTKPETNPYDAFMIPQANQASSEDIQKLASFVSNSRNMVVLTGAGFSVNFSSTESGIPDYRSPNGAYSKGHTPLLHKQFVESHATRQRYWARSIHGWKVFTKAAPNAGHFALAQMEEMGLVHHVITQNVDRLHLKAGTKSLIEIHGHLDAVSCLSCKTEVPRQAFQHRLEELNQGWLKTYLLSSVKPDDPSIIKPDGDVELRNVDYSKFVVPSCESCGTGVLKPTVVFFGDTVPRERVDHSLQVMEKADSLLVAGTSLMVFSAMRYVRVAAEKNIPIAIVNVGPTRGDELAKLKLEAQCGDVFPKLSSLLSASR